MPKTQVNPTEFAILGLLVEEPRSGYDIQKEVRDRLSHFWSESYGHLYPMLRRLQRHKLVTVKKVERRRGRPSRNVYAVTPAGRKALEAWFAEPPAPSRPRNELLLRVFLGRHAPTEALLRDLRAYREQVSTTLEQLRSVRAAIRADRGNDEDALYWQLSIDYGVGVFDALEKWSTKAEAALARAAPDSG